MTRPLVLVLVCIGLTSQADELRAHKDAVRRQPVQTSAATDVPAHPYDLILGRPTSNSVTLSVLAYEDTHGSIAYGTRSGQLGDYTPQQGFRKGEPVEIVLSGLQPDETYFYQFRGAQPDTAEHTFHTARPPGRAFTFTITADSHLDENTDPVLYQRTLVGALTGAPDFHIDLGDTFMTEKHPDRNSAAGQYVAQRYYLGQLCHSTPLFLVLGNHDGESPRGRGTDADRLAVWSNLMRKRYFPNPVPDDFYTGNAIKHPEAGLLEDYYAWEWGDALFVVLDPFWFTQTQRGRRDNWSRTLGTAQYQWLQRTLEASRAKFKFIIVHHLVGGLDNQCRGGAEAAPFYEWGGKNADGSDGFKQNRPGWPMPIHQLLVQHRVSVVFHGHDHLYAKQDLDGIVYQECPQPGDPRGSTRSATEYGYKSGMIMGSSGYLRVKVGSDSAKVEYVKTSPARGSAIADSYDLSPR